MSETPAASPQPSQTPEPSAPSEVVSRESPGTPQAKVITPEQAQSIKQKIKIKTKIDGVEEETELSEEEIQRDYQLWKASGNRFKESAELKRQALEVIEGIGDPQKLVATLKKRGYSDDQIQQLAEDFLYGRLKQAAMTPEQKELHELKLWRAQKEALEWQTLAQQQKAENDKKTSELRVTIEKDVIQALETSSIPPTASNVWRMADKLRVNLQRGININAKDAAELVYQDLIKEYKHLSSKLSPDKFAEVIGEDALNMIRKHDLSKVTNPISENRVKRPKGENPFQKPKRGYTTEKELQAYLDKKKAQR